MSTNVDEANRENPKQTVSPLVTQGRPGARYRKDKPTADRSLLHDVEHVLEEVVHTTTEAPA